MYNYTYLFTDISLIKYLNKKSKIRFKSDPISSKKVDMNSHIDHSRSNPLTALVLTIIFISKKTLNTYHKYLKFKNFCPKNITLLTTPQINSRLYTYLTT